MAAVSLALISCSTEPDDLQAARSRSRVVVTEGCGHASSTTGSGVLIDDELLLVSGHVVAGSSSVRLQGDGDAPGPALDVVALDPLRDLALLRSPGSHADEVRYTDFDTGDGVTMVGGAASGEVSAEVAAVLVIDIDEVRGVRRSERAGYRLDGATTRGDSGAGVYDRSGRLGGVVFATSSEDPSRTWVTAASEIAAFRQESTGADEAAATTWHCDPDQSQRVAIDPSLGSRSDPTDTRDDPASTVHAES